MPRWNALWYVPAWYGYLLALDALLFLRRGRSFVSHERDRLFSMLFWSVPFWLFFEACNLVLRNWYYVFGLRNAWAAAALTAVAFATVLPACFFHAELLEALGAFRRLSCRSRRIPPWAPPAVEGFGAACLAAALLFPRVAFPLIWFVPLGLEGYNRRHGAPSLLRDYEDGNCRRPALLLLGGLWAGGIWELFNFWARCKWIYAVPGFEGNKLFEMPLAGFLGFPVLAVSAFSFFSFIRQIGLRSKGRRLAIALIALLFCAAVYPAMQARTVRSVRPLLSELSDLDAPARGRLASAGIASPERLVRAARREGIEAIAARSGIPAPSLRRARDEAALALHKGMGVPRAELLRSARVGGVRELGEADTAALFRRLEDLAPKQGQEPPTLSEVRVWIAAARRSPDGLPRR